MSLTGLMPASNGDRVERRRCAYTFATAALLLFMFMLPVRPLAAAQLETDALIRDAMLYAYPYNEFMTMRHAALDEKNGPTATTLNRFRHQRALATPKDRWANAPVVDALYSTGWLDLGTSPVLLTLPDTAGRYYVIAMIGADLNTFGYVGRRLSGTAARRVVLVAPDWQGKPPAADQVIRAPTRDVYLNMRVLVDGPDDLARAQAVQDAFWTVPADSQAAPEAPKNTPRRGDWERFVNVANEALARNPPPAAEAPLLERYREVGICGAACSWDKLPADVQARWQALAPEIEKELKTALNADRRKPDRDRRNGWLSYRLPQTFGTNYRLRAGSAAMSGGILGLEAAEAIYFFASVDGSGTALGSGASYRLHLPQGRLPADAFWSISLYEFVDNGQFLLDNPIDRYLISDRTPGLRLNGDGSLDLWVAPTDPGPDKRANWLPSPADNRFLLLARIYQPWPEVLDPSWVPQPIEKLAR